MRLYSGKTIRNMIDRRIRATNETRDAILWDIDRENQIARVKIQGSDNLIVAHFPRNWSNLPYWCKRGNAVSIRHRNGNRGYVEVIGEGRAIPSPVSGLSMPKPSAAPDVVLTGCDLYATTPASMDLVATSGTYRINGVVYIFDPPLYSDDAIVMDDEPIMVLDAGTVMDMDTYYYTVSLDPAPADRYFRYDLFCVGTDGVLDYIAGTPAQTNPVKPSLPAGHVMVGDYILVRGGVTAVYNTDIGAEWKEALPTTLALSFDATFEWSGSTNTPTTTVTVTLQDQYGRSLSSSFTLTMTLMYGSGRLYSTDTGWSTSSVSQAVINAASYKFTYERDQSATEHSPMFLLSMTPKNLQTTCYIQLLDVNGEVIY